MKFAVIKTGGKQYLVHENDEVVVECLETKEKGTVNFETLASGDDEKGLLELGNPTLEKKVEGTVLNHVKGDKIRVARFKAKVRYRKVKGFRPFLSKIKITNI